MLGLRTVTSTDGMTADSYPFDMRFLGHVAKRVINEVKGVNRVVCDEQASRNDRGGVSRVGLFAAGIASFQRPVDVLG